MKSVIRFALIASALTLLAACNPTKRDDLKSPCAGAPGSPCDRRPVNDWWMS